jgi:uncharacterized metal-binding protein
MSSGIVHRDSSLLLAGSFILVGVFTLDQASIPYAVGSILGIVCSPDWDVDKSFIGDTYVRRLGRPFEWLWDRFLHVYRVSLKHGSPLSHWPIIGTLGRIIYSYFFIIFIPVFLYHFVFQPEWSLYDVFLKHIGVLVANWRILVGLASSDFIHFIMDKVTTNNRVFGGRLFRSPQRVLE